MAAAAVLVVTCASAWNVEGLRIWLDRTGLDHGVSLARIRTLTIEAYRYLSISPPVDGWAPPGSQGLGGVTRYIRECTTPEDRVFIAGFFPDVHFYSARGFAGGREDFNPDLHSSLRDQRMTVDRLERQSVPIVLIKRDLKQAPFVDAYLRQRYRLVPHIDPETTQGLSLFVERRRAPHACLRAAEHAVLRLMRPLPLVAPVRNRPARPRVLPGVANCRPLIVLSLLRNPPRSGDTSPFQSGNEPEGAARESRLTGDRISGSKQGSWRGLR